ncbi:MAG: hemolysin family protein [Planctomycetota bacterium]
MTLTVLSAASADDSGDEPPPAGGPSIAESATLAPAPEDVPGPPGAAAPNLSGTSLALGFIVCLAGAAFFSTLASSLTRALPSSVTSRSDDAERSAELARHLERTEILGATASLVAYALRVAASLALFGLVRATTELDLFGAGLATVAIGAPLLHLATQSLPVSLARSFGGRLVGAVLPTFARIAVPLVPVVALLRSVRRAVLRAVRTSDTTDGTRRLVEGFRAMVEGAEFDGDLGDDTREMIANVIEFGEADAAEVMTPRTEIRAVDAEAELSDAVAVFADAGYSRIPVYEESVDSIIGTLTALEAAKAVAEGRLESTRIRDIMRPPLLVPETVLVPALLAQFRAERQKMAIVVDEYGGTAGLVTLADVAAEIVGHVKDEYEGEQLEFRRLESGAVEADASLHVSDVNEALDLEIPEESDYETLAGFVLSEIGRFPSTGESFTAGGVTFRVTEASDRRVMRVTLDRAGGFELAVERPQASPGPHASAAPTNAGVAAGETSAPVAAALARERRRA